MYEFIKIKKKFKKFSDNYKVFKRFTDIYSVNERNE